MQNVVAIIREFEGILGTILGSAATLILTDILKKKGKLKIYLMDWKGIYQTYKNIGCYCRGKTDDDFYDFKINYILQIYNRSDIPKIMRNFKIVFYKGKKEVHSFIPDDEDTKRFLNQRYYIDKIEVVNINPKEIQVLKQSGYIGEEDLDKIENVNKVDLIYYDEKDRKRTVNLFNGIISKNSYSKK